MFWSKSLIPTLKESPQEAESLAHQLMLRAGLVRMLMAGVYSYLPMGLRVLNNIERIIRQEMNNCSAAELLLPALQPKELWARSGRDKVMGEVMLRFVDRKGRNICLGPTHEEVITELVKNNVSSYRHLPLLLYQIQTKFRDEIRPRFGLVRGCEFIMKDAYSFDKDQAGLDKNYKLMYDAYLRIFKRCGLDILAVEADSGVMGGSVSHEFMVRSLEGEDKVLVCPQCAGARPFKEGSTVLCPECGVNFEPVNTLEVGHIFQLGTKYSQSLEAKFVDASGASSCIIMGCYGIGVSRLIPAIIDNNHDDLGIIWPDEVSPYKVLVMALDMNDAKIGSQAVAIYNELNSSGIDSILDDRDERAGVKFKDADLTGINLQIIVGRDFLKQNTVELKIRRENKKVVDSPENILAKVKGLCRV